MRISIISLFFCLLLGTLVAQPISSKQIDSLVELTLKTFDVPGIAVGVVKDGKLIHAKGYGVRSLVTKEKTDENTLFGVASNSKAFTAAALGMLVDEGKLKWDDKVTDIITGFKLYSPYVTEEFTVRDLLTHRSGLGLGAGDLMFWPDSSDFTKKDIIHNLRYLKPVSSFRTKYDYDNLLYMVAGEVVANISGTSWEDFIETRIMKPLGMTYSVSSLSRLKNNTNIIDGHAPVNGKVTAIPKEWNETVNAAGGICSNITDLSKWIIMQMNNGKYGENGSKQLFSEAVHDEMWTPQTIIPVRNPGSYNTHFSSYGLGWFLSDVMGYKQCTHTGGLAGTVTQITLIPELKLGIIVLTNQQVGAAFNTISATIKDSYLGITGKNRLKEYHDRVLKNDADAKKITDNIWADIEKQQKTQTSKPDFAQYVGTYKDNWLGDATITLKNNQLRLVSKRSPRLRGDLLFYKANTFVVKWDDRSFDADAFVQFNLDNNGKAAGFTMKTISPLTDFSFDFQDLDFKKAE